ncbi:MAG: tRNA (adenosine(37)-N6)-threonylcarbamoyltransferase complex ATPase subunit type 1 TsaE [Clostridia bacterium]|nr:tRNA (adenosine(37)-N6)-threonylcarbamoyltransferase complex ATPase subunit type 1 TsaE [Clostridia bacterium]
MKEYFTNSPETTEEIAKEFASTLKGDEVVALYGGLGMGKTTFVRGLCSYFGINSGVSSPTFAIVNEYNGDIKIFHFDMYRINSWDDLYSTGFFDYLGQGLCIIEWSENIEAALPDNTVRIEFQQGENFTDRTIKRIS